MHIAAKSNTIATLEDAGHSIDISTSDLEHALQLCASWAPPPFAPGLYLMSEPLANKFDFTSINGLPRITAQAAWAAMTARRGFLRPLTDPDKLYYRTLGQATPHTIYVRILSTLEQWRLVEIIA